MMMNKQLKFFVGTTAALFLAACGAQGSDQNSGQQSQGTATEQLDSPFPLTVENEGTPIANGMLRYALVSNSPIPGIFNAVHYETSLAIYQKFLKIFKEPKSGFRRLLTRMIIRKPIVIAIALNQVIFLLF